MQRLKHLGDKLDSMTAGEVLTLLHEKLTTLQKTLVRFPDVSYTLTYTLDRISDITSLESRVREFHLQIQELGTTLPPAPFQTNNLGATSPESRL